MYEGDNCIVVPRQEYLKAFSILCVHVLKYNHRMKLPDILAFAFIITVFPLELGM